MVRDRVLETLRLAAPELKSGVSTIPPIPHITVPFTLTVSLKSGWGFRHRTETEGVKVPFATITTIPNIQTALFIQPTAIGTVYEDLGGNHEYQLRLAQPTQKGEASSSCTISLISDVTLPTRLGLRPIALHHSPLFTSATLHLLSVLLSHFQRTRTRQSRSLKDCGSILLAVGWLDYIVITSYVSQLVNHLRTRTPMGDLVEQSRLALDL